MEDLQDVLEDVTYMNAMSDDSPKPTKAWDLPDEAALAEFCGRELAADPQAFALEKICQNSLGFYLFCRFCKEAGGEADAAKARFLEDVVRYKRTLGDKGKALLAVKMMRRYLLPRGGPPDPQAEQRPSTIHEDAAAAPVGASTAVGGATAVAAAAGTGYSWLGEEEEEEELKVNINEGDLRRLPNASLSRAELISCYQDALEDAERRLAAARAAQQKQQQQQAAEEQVRGGLEGASEKMASTTSTASTHSPSGGSSLGLGAHHHLPFHGHGHHGHGHGQQAAPPAPAAALAQPSAAAVVNALGLGGHIKDEVVETIQRVAEPMAREFLEAERGGQPLHAPTPPPQPAAQQQQPQQPQRGRHARGGGQRGGGGGRGGAQPLSPQQKGLGGWRPGGGQKHKAPPRGVGPKEATPTPLMTAGLPAGLGVAAAVGGAVSPVSKGSVMQGGDDSEVEEGAGTPPPTTGGDGDAPVAAMLPPQTAAPAAAMPPPATTGLGGSRTGGATATAAAGGGGGGAVGPVPIPGGVSSTVTNTTDMTNNYSSLLQQASTPGGLAPLASPGTPPPWQQEQEAAEGDGEGFFGRMRQRLSAGLFDKLELIVWEHVASRQGQPFLASPLFRKYQQFAFLSKRPVNEEDFVLFRVLGRGGFGQVNGCKRCQTGKLYAMKVMNKRRVKAHQSEKLCWNERRILSLVDSPFVVCLKYAFTSKEDLFLILDLMRGGDLAFHLDKRGRFTMDEARYFAARTLLGLQHLHKNGIVYRDLKPDNILMDERGKTRISDLGLACKVTPDLVGCYGTRGYWAPEMLMKDSRGHRIRYTQCVDWFSFGCVIYEMIIGFSPFRSERIYEWSGLTKKDKHKAIDMAVIGMEPDFDRRYFDEDSIDLCKKLLEKDPRKRLGAKGSADVMAHPWFLKGGVEWDVFMADAAEPPFIPNQDINAASQSAIGSFNDENQYRKMKIDEADHEVYNGWGWVSQSSFFSEVVQFLKAEEVQGPIVPAQSAEGCCVVS